MSAIVSVISIFMLGLLMRGVLVDTIAFGGTENSNIGFIQSQSDNDFTAIKDNIPKKVDLSVNNGNPIRITKGTPNVDFYGFASYINSQGQKIVFNSSDDLYVTGTKKFPNIQIFVIDMKTGLQIPLQLNAHSASS